MAKRKQKEVEDLLRQEGVENISLEQIKSLDRDYQAHHLSPGGAADLLAVTFLLYFLDTKENASTQNKALQVE